MSQEYFAILTAIGEAKDAAAKAGGAPLKFARMVVGDGGGAATRPDAAQTALVREVWGAQLNQLSVDPVNSSQVIAESVIPEQAGGWWVREIGLLDDDGDLVAVANCPPSYKPQMPEGSARTQVIRVVLIVSSAETVLLSIDPGIVMATRQFAEETASQKFDALAQDDGAEQVGFGKTTVAQALRDFVSIRQYGALGNGRADDQPAFQLARYDSNRIYFPRVNGADTMYFLASAPVEMLSGTVLRADPGVTISWPTGNNYALFDDVTFDTDICCEFRDSKTTNFHFAKTPSRHKLDHLALPGPALRRNRIALDCTNPAMVNLRRVAWPAGDVFSAADGTTAYDGVSMAATNGGSFAGAFVRIGVYETISAHFDSGLAAGVIGVMIRGTDGYALLYGTSSSENFTFAVKRIGEPVLGDHPNLSWADLGQGRYTSFAPGNSVWSVSKTAPDRVVVKLNGKALTAPYLAGVGIIHEMGFVSYGAVAHQISGFTLERRTDAVIGMPKLREMRIFGDSTADSFPSSWDKLLRPLLDTMRGVKVDRITNFAMNGDNIQQQYVALTQNGVGDAYYVILCIGTNDVQGLRDIEEFKNIVRAMLAYIISLGCKPVVMLPWMWYTQAQSGGAGQGSANYNRGAPYRMWLERIAYELGAVVVKLPEELPNPDPLLITTEPHAKLLRDNIHQDMLADQLYVRALGGAIIDDYMSLPDSVQESVSALMLGTATASSDLKFCYGKDGRGSLAGTMGVAGIVNGSPVMDIPRYLVGQDSENVGAIALDASLTPIGSCWLNIDSNTCRATLQRPPAGTASIIVGGRSWKAAASAV